jgi:hypothetical protein
MKNKTLWIVLAFVAVILAGIISIFAPSYMKQSKQIDELTIQRDEYHSQVQTLSATVSDMKESTSKRSASGTIREPIDMGGGKIAYREASWKTSGMDSVKESVAQALKEFQSVQTLTQTVTITAHETETKTVRRAKFDVGLGYSTDNKLAGMIGYGSIIGVWIVGKSNIHNVRFSNIKINEGIGGLKISF